MRNEGSGALPRAANEAYLIRLVIGRRNFFSGRLFPFVSARAALVLPLRAVGLEKHLNADGASVLAAWTRGPCSHVLRVPIFTDDAVHVVARRRALSSWYVKVYLSAR
jgi:hypothetical protein